MCARASLQVWGLLLLLGADAQFHLDPPRPEGEECGRIGDEVWKCQKAAECAEYSRLASSGRRITCSTDVDGPIICCPPDRFPNRGLVVSSISQIKCAEYQTTICGGAKFGGASVGSSVVDVGSSSGYPEDFDPLFSEVLPDEESSSPRSRRQVGGDGSVPEVGILGGVPANPKEFPHSALIGYPGNGKIIWMCGGTLISERYVLSAAHCVPGTASIDDPPPRWILLGDLDYSNDKDDADPQQFNIVQTFLHHAYNPSSSYNDIVLFRLDRDAVFNDYVSPACLHPSKPRDLTVLTATGWGLVNPTFKARTLMKVNISSQPDEECRTSYKVTDSRPNVKLAKGFNSQTMLCASGYGKDTCQGDSGGPLILADPGDSCLAQLVGVTSFGPRMCVFNTAPGVYSRVSEFLPWIESIVWPGYRSNLQQ